MEDRALLVFHRFGLLVIQGEACDIRGQYVRRELDSSVIEAHRLREGQRHRCFAYARNILHQDMSAREDTGQSLCNDVILTADCFLDLIDDVLRYGIHTVPLVKMLLLIYNKTRKNR